MSVHYIKCHVFFSPGTGNIKELLKFWNLSKTKKKEQWNNKTKKKNYIYLTVFPQSVFIQLLQSNELVHYYTYSTIHTYKT